MCDLPRQVPAVPQQVRGLPRQHLTPGNRVDSLLKASVDFLSTCENTWLLFAIFLHTAFADTELSVGIGADWCNGSGLIYFSNSHH